MAQRNITIGIRREEKLNSNPGPGEYEQDASKRIQGQNMGSVRIGTAERKDIFEANMKVAQSQPAPGEYEEKTTFGQGPSATMKGKWKETTIQGPGPGYYE